MSPALFKGRRRHMKAWISILLGLLLLVGSPLALSQEEAEEAEEEEVAERV